MSIKAFKYRIYANTATTEKLHWVLDRCRELYNAGLQERRNAYEIGIRLQRRSSWTWDESSFWSGRGQRRQRRRSLRILCGGTFTETML